jgi:hypothetical protein
VAVGLLWSFCALPGGSGGPPAATATIRQQRTSGFAAMRNVDQSGDSADERVIYSAHCGARSQHPIGTVPARGIGHASLEYVQSGHDDEPTTPVGSIAATHVAQLLSPIIDSRWVSHQLIDDRCGLRTDLRNTGLAGLRRASWHELEGTPTSDAARPPLVQRRRPGMRPAQAQA